MVDQQWYKLFKISLKVKQHWEGNIEAKGATYEED